MILTVILTMWRDTIPWLNDMPMYHVCQFSHAPGLHISLEGVAFYCSRRVHWNVHMPKCWGLEIDCRIRLIAISVCGSSWSQRFGGSGFWSCLWLSWLHCVCSNLVAPIPYPVCTCHKCSLLRTSFLGTMPARLSHSRSVLYARIILASLQFFMGLTRMVLLSICTMTMMYLLLQRDQMGNWPVRSENMVLHTIYVWVYRSRTFFPWRWKVSHVSNGDTLTLVYHSFFLVWFRSPFAVLIVLG